MACGRLSSFRSSVSGSIWAATSGGSPVPHHEEAAADGGGGATCSVPGGTGARGSVPVPGNGRPQRLQVVAWGNVVNPQCGQRTGRRPPGGRGKFPRE